MTNTAAPLRELPAVTVRMSGVMEWVKTSPPVAVQDKRRGTWMLKLRYTQSTKKRTRLVWSPSFETQGAALAAAGWWRLSWEQGHNGEEISPHTGSDQVSSTAAADLVAADLPQGKSENSMGRLNAVQERQYKKQRKDGGNLSRSDWMKSTVLTEREKRCLTRGWTKREAGVNKKFQNRHSYLKRRVVEMEEAARKDDELIRRLRRCIMCGVEELLFDDDKDESGSPNDGAAASGAAKDEAEEVKVSAAQMKRLVAQARKCSKKHGYEICLSRRTSLTLSRIRRFARRTRDYCRAYLKLEKDATGIESKDKIEKMRKTCKAHRNIIDMEPGFIDTQ